MSLQQDERTSRAERRRRRQDDLAARRESQGPSETAASNQGGGGAAAGDGAEAQLKTVAKVAAVGAAMGAAIAAARAATSRGSEPDAEPGASESSATDTAAAHRDEPQDTEHRDESSDSEDVRVTNASDRNDEGSTYSEDEPEAHAEPASLQDGQGPAGKVLRQAVQQLSAMAGHPAEGVLGFERTEDGWLVDVELVELERIPSTTDLLGAYEVRLDENGDIQTYRRVRRYVRSQADTSEEK
jgi:hypothetical protein